MSWILHRVDDRLIHGQVVVAWGQRMRPARIVVADDASASNDWERELLESAAPDVQIRVVSLADAAAGYAAEAVVQGGAFLLVRSLAAALQIVEAGAAIHTLNLGGIHYAPGRTKVNEYLYLNDRDRAAARALIARGVALEAQDVPATRPQSLRDLDPALASP
jgi:mannose/fructose/N-acetylgalactosamine-specific phosphotransferase system component IIB